MRSSLRWANPNFDKVRSLIPNYPVIVLLGEKNPLVDFFIKSSFPNFKEIDGKQVMTSLGAIQDFPLAKEIAHQSIECFKGEEGALISNFPITQVQAQSLDNVLDGVNLAINFTISAELKAKAQGGHLGCTTCGKVFNSKVEYMIPDTPGLNQNCDDHLSCNFEKIESIANKTVSEEILKFYQERGLLMNFHINGDFENFAREKVLERFNQMVIAKYKL